MKATPVSSDRFPMFELPLPLVISLKPAQGKLSPLGARAGARGAKSRISNAGLLFLALFEEFQQHLEDLDAAPLVRALGLKQRIFARPPGRPLDHQSGREAGSVLAHPRSGLLQKPCLHAAEGHRGSHYRLKRLCGFLGKSTIRACARADFSLSRNHSPGPVQILLKHQRAPPPAPPEGEEICRLPRGA